MYEGGTRFGDCVAPDSDPTMLASPKGVDRRRQMTDRRRLIQRWLGGQPARHIVDLAVAEMDLPGRVPAGALTGRTPFLPPLATGVCGRDA